MKGKKGVMKNCPAGAENTTGILGSFSFIIQFTIWLTTSIAMSFRAKAAREWL